MYRPPWLVASTCGVVTTRGPLEVPIDDPNTVTLLAVRFSVPDPVIAPGAAALPAVIVMLPPAVTGAASAIAPPSPETTLTLPVAWLCIVVVAMLPPAPEPRLMSPAVAVRPPAVSPPAPTSVTELPVDAVTESEPLVVRASITPPVA